MTEKVAVYIGTTHGPVRIERICHEAVPLSEVFVGRGIEPIPEISAEYDNFVRPGRPVDKAFGPFNNKSFRMDLSQEIKAGRSWQLAAFVAHGLETQGRLASPTDIYQRVFVLTGAVNADFQIGDVAYIAEKLEALTALTMESRSAGKDIQIIVPKNETFQPTQNNNLIAMSDAKAVFEFCNGKHESQLLRKKRVSILHAIIIVLALLVCTVGVYFYHYKTDKQPLPDTVIKADFFSKRANIEESIKVFEMRPPEEETCAAVRFSNVDAVLIPVEVLADQMNGIRFKDSQAKLLCGLKFEFNTFDSKYSATAHLFVETGKFVSQKSVETIKAFNGKLIWAIDLPDFQSRGFRYKLSLKSKTSVHERVHRVLP